MSDQQKQRATIIIAAYLGEGPVRDRIDFRADVALMPSHVRFVLEAIHKCTGQIQGHLGLMVDDAEAAADCPHQIANGSKGSTP